MRKRKTAKSDGASAAASPNDETIFSEDGTPETPAAGLTDAEKALMEDLKAKEKEPAESSAEPAAASVAFAPAAEPEPEAAPDEPERRERRGRPKGSTGKKKKEREAGTPETLTKLLLSCHEMLAALTGIPELLLSQEEAQKMGEAVHDVEVLYGELPYISPEVRAWTNLALTSVLIYWPRYVVIRKREREEAKRDIDVTPIRPPGSGVAPNMSREGTGSVS